MPFSHTDPSPSGSAHHWRRFRFGRRSTAEHREARRTELWERLPLLTTPRETKKWLRLASRTIGWSQLNIIYPDKDFFAKVSVLSPVGRAQLQTLFTMVKTQQATLCDTIGIATLPVLIATMLIGSEAIDDGYFSFMIFFIFVYLMIYTVSRSHLAVTTVYIDAIATCPGPQVDVDAEANTKMNAPVSPKKPESLH